MRNMRNGAYTLTCSIPNPLVDGRKRNDWKHAAVFKPDTYFVTTHVDSREPRMSTINVRKLHGYPISIGKRNEEDFAPFLDALVPDDSLDSLVRYQKIQNYVDPVDVLMRLVEAGVVSDDAVRVALVAQQQADDAAAEVADAALKAKYAAEKEAAS